MLGRLPVGSRLARRVLQQVRPWIEPAQSFEKNQLGMSAVFFNSLRLTWVISLLADAAVLLRARALLGRPVIRPLLSGLMPFQLSLELGGGGQHAVFTRTKRKPSDSPMNSAFHTLVFATPSKDL